MKVWEIPQEQLDKWLKWVERQNKWSSAFGLIERLTGIKPAKISEGGLFSFIPVAGAVIPDHFTKPGRNAAIRPRANHPEGKRLLKLWEAEEIPSIHSFHFWPHMGIECEFGSGVFEVDQVGGVSVLVAARGWTPEKYGYVPKEI